MSREERESDGIPGGTGQSSAHGEQAGVLAVLILGPAVRAEHSLLCAAATTALAALGDRAVPPAVQGPIGPGTRARAVPPEFRQVCVRASVRATCRRVLRDDGREQSRYRTGLALVDPLPAIARGGVAPRRGVSGADRGISKKADEREAVRLRLCRSG